MIQLQLPNQRILNVTSLQNGSSDDHVILVHGGPIYGYISSLATELAKTSAARIWYFEQAGSKLNPLGSDSPTVQTHINDLTTLIKMVKKDCRGKLTLIGHSWGGLLSLLTVGSEELSKIVDGIILVDPMPASLELMGQFSLNISARLTPEVSKRHQEIMSQILTVAPDVQQNLFEELSHAIFPAYQHEPSAAGQPDVILPELNAQVFFSTHGDLAAWVMDGRVSKALNNVNCPVHMIYGVSDPCPSLQVSQQLTEALPGKLTTTAIENCGHYPWWEPTLVKSQFLKILTTAMTNN